MEALAASVLHDVVAPATVVIGPAGVFVALTREHGGKRDLRGHVRVVRRALDAAGLCALPIVGTLGPPATAVMLAESDTRFSASTVERAVRALAPSFVAALAAPLSPPVPSSGDENRRLTVGA
jgi:hypothetical protein